MSTNNTHVLIFFLTSIGGLKEVLLVSDDLSSLPRQVSLKGAFLNRNQQAKVPQTLNSNEFKGFFYISTIPFFETNFLFLSDLTFFLFL